MTQQAVIFDVGRVLIEWDMRAPFRHLLTEAQMDTFLADTDLPKWNLKFDAGMPFSEGLGILTERMPHHAEALNAFDEKWQTAIPAAIAGSVAILDQLRVEQVPVYAITNFSAEKWPIACDLYPFLADSFLDVVVSGQEGVLKPDAEIFQRLMSRNSLEAQNCIFIDDSPKNVAGALAIGIDGILFTDPTQLHNDLKQRGLLNREVA